MEKGRKKIEGEKKKGEMGANKVLWEWMREGRTGGVRCGEEGKSSHRELEGYLWGKGYGEKYYLFPPLTDSRRWRLTGGDRLRHTALQGRQ